MSKVSIGYPHGRDVSYVFHESLLKTLAHPGLQERLHQVHGVSCGAYSLDRARNDIVEKFLDREADWLLQIDTDMQWEPIDVVNILATAHKTKRPVVGGLCFRIMGNNPDVGHLLTPTLFRFTGKPEDGDGTAEPVINYSGVEKVDVTGAAFLLVHRSAYEAIGGRWFSHHPLQTESSEDFAFCLRLREQGIPVHVDTRVKIGHEKHLILTEREYHWMGARLSSVMDARQRASLRERVTRTAP